MARSRSRSPRGPRLRVECLPIPHGPPTVHGGYTRVPFVPAPLPLWVPAVPLPVAPAVRPPAGSWDACWIALQAARAVVAEREAAASAAFAREIFEPIP
jgi:hypothetical protein